MAGNILRSSQYTAVGAASAKFTNPMQPGQKYRFVANTDCWVKVTATGGAAAANTADNHLYVSTMGELILENPDSDATTNAFVHVIQDSTGGDATLSLIE